MIEEVIRQTPSRLSPAGRLLMVHNSATDFPRSMVTVGIGWAEGTHPCAERTLELRPLFDRDWLDHLGGPSRGLYSVRDGRGVRDDLCRRSIPPKIRNHADLSRSRSERDRNRKQGWAVMPSPFPCNVAKIPSARSRRLGLSWPNAARMRFEFVIPQRRPRTRAKPSGEAVHSLKPCPHGGGQVSLFCARSPGFAPFLLSRRTRIGPASLFEVALRVVGRLFATIR